MSRFNIKYQIAHDDAQPSDYFLHVQEFSNSSKKEVSYWSKIFQSLLLILFYLILSVGLTFYQQWLYKSYGFNFPLGVVAVHLCVKYILSAFVRMVRRCYKGQQHPKVSWKNIIWAIVPPGVASGLDIGLSNWAVSLVTISLYTMTKSTTIIFLLGFSLLFKLERKSWSLFGIVVMISSGLIMFTYKSTQLHILGFILCIIASFLSGMRWTMAQLIMQKSKIGLRNPIDMMYYMQPWMLLSLLPAVFIFEGSIIYEGIKNIDWNDTQKIATTITAVISGAFLAFHMEVMEFLVVTYTSSLTLSISGIVKEICMLVLAFEWNGDQMSLLNFIGLLMCLGGITLHVVKKILDNKTKTFETHEMQSSSLSNNLSKNDDLTETNVPLLMQKSTSLTNLLSTNFSSDEDDDHKVGNSSQILSDILQRREP